jgi:predicted nucleotidyltransferase
MTKEESRPATLDDLKFVIRILNEHDVDYLLIGGYALHAHNYIRGTTDIDILVPATRATGVKVCKALLLLPDSAAKDIDLAWFEEGDTIRVADEFVVDIMFSACGQNYETLSKYAETIEVDGIPIRTVNLEGLLLTKKTFRDKDVSDRIILERALELYKKAMP